MKIIFGLVIVSLLFTPILNACAKNVCQGMAVNNICSKMNTLTELYTYACPAGQYCDWSTFSLSSSGICKPWDTQSGTSPRVEFDACTMDSECAGSKCENNACIGLKLNVTCTKSEMCGANLYCDDGKKSCQTRKVTGATCARDLECANDHGCLFSKCTKLYSYSVGTKVAEPSNTNFKMIYFFYCESQFASSSTGKCEHVSPVSSTCTFNFGTKNSCEYVSADTNEKISVDTMCSCSYNSNEAELCGKATNTAEKKAYIASQLALLAKPCHYYNRGKCTLVSAAEQLQNYKNRMVYLGMDVSRYPCFVNVDSTGNAATFVKTFFALLAVMMAFVLL